MIDLDGGIEVCQRKAYTALFGVGTLELGSSIKTTLRYWPGYLTSGA